MTVLILSIHIISCVLLILIVLLQTGKGADMGASFGSASGQSLFGGGGPATALSKITTVVAIVFMLTSLTMAYTSGHKSSQTIMPKVASPINGESATTDTNVAESTNKASSTETSPVKESSTKEDSNKPNKPIETSTKSQ